MMFLAPGVDVAGVVESLGRKLGYTLDNGKYKSVSLGQVTSTGFLECQLMTLSRKV